MSSMSDVNPEHFRHAMTCFASGITAVTAQEAGQPAGLIATSVCSLSADPATVLVCVNKTASAHDVILRTRHFAVNLLSAEQTAVAQRFMSARGADRFDPACWTEGRTGSPLLVDAVVAFDCTLVAVHDGFTHSIMVGRIADAAVNEDLSTGCLLWHHHGYAQSTLSAA